MRLIFLLPLLLLASCQPERGQAKTGTPAPPEPAPLTETHPAPADVKRSVVRINSTQQSWNPWQPWEKTPPRRRRALAAIVRPQRVITTAELVADATYLEFESSDGTRFCSAKVVAVDYEANFALLAPADEAEGNLLFEGTLPFEITTPQALGSTLDILQIEENGVALQTPGRLQSIDLESNFLPGNPFLTYRVKASMQSAASSYSLPVLHGDQLAGVLISYNSKDQLCDVAATDTLLRFLKEATNGEYGGFPSLGVGIARTEDSAFRDWLKLTDDQGGLYVRSVRKGGSADAAGIRKGDVILAVDGQAIDRRGYYEHPLYGKLSWGHLIRGEKTIGETIKLSLLRDGEALELDATLTRLSESDRLVPIHLFDRAPNFLIKGGLVFQELSRPILQGFGEDWLSRAPLNLLDAYKNPEDYQENIDRVVFLSGTIPTPATIGYEQLRNLIVTKVNDRDIKDMKSLIEAFEHPRGSLHSIRFDEEDLTINLDENTTAIVDGQLLQRGISRLSRLE